MSSLLRHTLRYCWKVVKILPFAILNFESMSRGLFHEDSALELLSRFFATLMHERSKLLQWDSNLGSKDLELKIPEAKTPY